MIEEQAGEIEKRDIRDQVGRILRDLGHPEPPLKLADVRALRSLDLRYYSSADPGLVTELTHRFTLVSAKNNSRPQKLSPDSPFKVSALGFLDSRCCENFDRHGGSKAEAPLDRSTRNRSQHSPMA